MILDIRPTIKQVDDFTREIMDIYNQMVWIRFVDLNDSTFSGIVDFRDNRELSEFLSEKTVSQFMKMQQRGRLRSIRTHRKNIKRHDDPNFTREWNCTNLDIYWNPHYGFCCAEFSEQYLRDHKRMKLKCIKLV